MVCASCPKPIVCVEPIDQNVLNLFKSALSSENLICFGF
jgi:hypothetical protein